MRMYYRPHKELMSSEPRRIRQNFLPSELYVIDSRTSQGAFEVVTLDGELLAEVRDINVAHMFAASPKLLDALDDARREVVRFCEVFLGEEEDAWAEGTRLGDLIRSMDEALGAVDTPEGLYP